MNFKLVFIPLILLSGCQKTVGSHDDWLGRWIGPEGTYLNIAREEGQYSVTIHDLDGPKKFSGQETSSGIKFVRYGQSETIHAGNGNDTGMKWLADKKTCLVVRKGEGYCRG